VGKAGEQSYREDVITETLIWDRTVWLTDVVTANSTTAAITLTLKNNLPTPTTVVTVIVPPESTVAVSLARGAKFENGLRQLDSASGLRTLLLVM